MHGGSSKAEDSGLRTVDSPPPLLSLKTNIGEWLDIIIEGQLLSHGHETLTLCDMILRSGSPHGRVGPRSSTLQVGLHLTSMVSEGVCAYVRLCVCLCVCVDAHLCLNCTPYT